MNIKNIKTEEKQTSKRFFTTTEIQAKIIQEVSKLKNVNADVQQYNYLYVTHKIIYHMTMNKGKTDGCRINMKQLAELFSKSNGKTTLIIRNLIKWRIIIRNIPADIKQASAKYIIDERYSLENNIVMINVTVNDVTFINKLIDLEVKPIDNDKIIKQTKNILKSSLSVNNNGIDYFYTKYVLSNNNLNTSIIPIDGCLSDKPAEFVQKTGIFLDKIKDKISGGYKVENVDIALFLILIKDYNCTRPDDARKRKSRLYNNLTNLSREHRKYISLNGKPILMTDISNSQILFTVPQIEKYYKVISGKGAKGIPEDVLRFKELAQSGKFYETLAQHMSINLAYDDRVDFKKNVFQEIWFGPIRRKKSEIKTCFRKLFPNVHKYICSVKKAERYQLFSIDLQQFEAKIMIDTVAKKLLNDGRSILTLHDAIVTSCEDDLAIAEDYIFKAMAKHNIKPKFKREQVEISSDNEVLDISVATQGTLKKEVIKAGNRPSLPNLKQISKPTNREIVQGEIS